MPPGPQSDNVWHLNSVDVLDFGPTWLNVMVASAARAWDSVMTGIRFNYQNKGHKQCEQIDKKDGAVVVCAQGINADTQTRVWTDHNEITAARIWIASPIGPSTTEDAEMVSHEFGHAVGLHHYNELDSRGAPVSIMHPFEYSGSISPKAVDVQALQRMGYMSAANPQRKKGWKRRN